MTRLENYRQSKKLSYYSFGQLIGFSGINPAVSAERYCKGTRFPRPKVLMKIKEITKISADEMLDDYIQKNK